MRAFLWIILIAFVLLAVFTIANWSLFTAPATLDFLFFSVQGPLGLVLLGVTLGFVLLFAVYALFLRTTALVEQRRHTRELQVQRELAEKAEASRYTTLTNQLEPECARLRAVVDESRSQTLTRADALEQSLRRSIDETAKAIFANIGALDDKVDRLRAAER